MAKKKRNKSKKEEISTQKDESVTKPDKQSFWSTPTGIAALVTAILTGIATVITALPPLISAISPSQTPQATPPIETRASTPTTSCDDYFNPDDLPVYDSYVGIPASLHLIKPITAPFALKFIEDSKTIGGMKIEYEPNDDCFAVISNVDGNCLERHLGNQVLQNKTENQLRYEEQSYRFTLTYDHDLQELLVDLRME